MALRLKSALLILCLTPGLAGAAGIPDPSLSTVPNVLVVPGGSAAYSVTIVGSGGPIAAATVELRYTTAGVAEACFCQGQVQPVVSAMTNGSGVATFNISGGQCLDPAAIAGGVAIEVYVNDIKLKEIGQVSPDVNALPDGTCEAALSDAVSFTSPLSTSVYSFCYDLNSDGAVGLTDAVLFTPAASAAASCSE